MLFEEHFPCHLISYAFGETETSKLPERATSSFLSFFLLCICFAYHTLPYPKTKPDKIYTKDKIEPQHVHQNQNQNQNFKIKIMGSQFFFDLKSN